MPRAHAWLPFALLALASCESCGGNTPATDEPLARPEVPDLGVLPDRPSGSPRRWSPLGTNLDGPADWTEAFPFIDQFRLSRPWTSSTGLGLPDDERPIDVDAHGWVRSLAAQQIVRTGVMWDVETARPGRYVVRWEGTGRLELFGAVEDRVVERGERRLVVDFDPARDGTGFGLAILETDPNDPLRKIQVIEPGGACAEDHARFCDASAPCGDAGECLSFEEHHEELVFDPDFLRTLSSYRAIRFMNWQSTNDSEERSWDDRPEVDDARWSEPGVPVEILIALANALDAEPWLCVPHRADDDYARQMGALVAEELAPGVPVHVELSNEIWNGIFTQHEYAIEEGHRRRVPGHDEDDSLAQLHWQARRSVEVFEAFDAGFGAEAGSRVRHALGSHSANPWTAQRMLEFEDTAEHVDELAIAPYFGTFVGPENRDEVLEGGADALFEEASERGLPMVLDEIRQNAELAAEHDVALVAYEAGQHFVGVRGVEQDEAVEALLHAVNRDPRMGALYTRYLEGWREAGGQLLVHFVHAGGWGPYGSWGALEHVRQDPSSAPKYLALERFARTVRPWWR